jgi:ABC-2 type transport system permease protein
MTDTTLSSSPSVMTRRSASAFTMFVAQTRAELLSMLRNPSSLVPTVLFPVMFWMFFGLPNARQTSSDGFQIGAYILASFAMYSVIQTVLFNLGIFIAIERSTGWYRFQRTTPIRVPVMFAAKIVSVLLLALFALSVLLVVGALTGGIGLSVQAWASLVARVLFGVLPFAALAVFIGYLARNANAASPIINLLFFPMAFASGLFIPLRGLPQIVQDIAPYLPAYHSGELARVAAGVPSASSEWTHVIWILGFTVVFLVCAVWAYRRDEGVNYR